MGTRLMSPFLLTSIQIPIYHYLLRSLVLLSTKLSLFDTAAVHLLLNGHCDYPRSINKVLMIFLTWWSAVLNCITQPQNIAPITHLDYKMCRGKRFSRIWGKGHPMTGLVWDPCHEREPTLTLLMIFHYTCRQEPSKTVIREPLPSKWLKVRQRPTAKH